MKRIIFFFCMILSFATHAQDPAAFSAGKAENSFVYSKNTIKIFTGQRISIKSEKLAAELTDLQLVDTGASNIKSQSSLGLLVLKQNSSKDITIDFNTVQGENGKPVTYLIVNNPSKGVLSYKAKIFSRRTNDYQETSIYDIAPGISGIEMWPYAITDFVLYDFKIRE